MAWWNFKREKAKETPPAKSIRAKNRAPELEGAYQATRAHFFSNDVDRYLNGWDTQSHSIDFYLRDELEKIRARARKLSRNNPFGARYIQLLRNNVVGNCGFSLQSKASVATNPKQLDTLANDAIEAAFKDWASNHCDIEGICSLKEFTDSAVSLGATDGEFIFELVRGNVNKYGFALRQIDPELLDIQKNELTKNGEIRLGVEYNSRGQRIRYHFKERNFNGDYSRGKTFTKSASVIIHGFIPEAPNQTRGVPWMTPGLEKAKHLEKFIEAAIVRARATASRVAALKTNGTNAYSGEEEGEDGVEYDLSAAGEVWDIGNRELQQLDADYPTAMYSPFVIQNIRDLAAAWGVSYQALSADLSDTSFGSARTGVMEERETYKTRQEWLIRQFLNKVYEAWLVSSVLNGAITMGNRKTPLMRPVDDYKKWCFQPKRWAWIDPAKDMQANTLAVTSHFKSYSQIMREQGDDPESTWQEIAADKERLAALGLTPVTQESETQNDIEEEPEA